MHSGNSSSSSPAGSLGVAEADAEGLVDVEALADADAVASGADSLADALGVGVVSGVDSLADGEGLLLSVADSVAEVLGVGVVSSVAYATGAASSATGAMTAVAAAAAMARRSFMKTSESPAYRRARYERW
ncbi:hypothetical protein [Streptomyces sp. NPDC002611]